MGCTVTACTASASGGDGIVGGTGTVISGCSAGVNEGVGIRVGTGSAVVDCTSRDNDVHGVVCTDNCLIARNHCDSNSVASAGVLATGGGNRIVGNTCTSAGRGVDVDGTGNLIIRNACSGNSVNWSIVVGNSLAPIVNTGTNASAVGGNTYAGSLGTTDPNANFTY